MEDRQQTSVIIDGLLKFLMTGGVITAAIIAPNSLLALDKPLQTAFRKLNQRERERELKRVLNYMKRGNLINTASYVHGIAMTEKGRKRAKTQNLNTLFIAKPKTWDGQWRIVFFDIPEAQRNERVVFSSRLRRLGFQQLQLSTWIHPFPCRQEIEILVSHLDIQPYVTYIETSYIDNPKPLLKRFSKLL